MAEDQSSDAGDPSANAAETIRSSDEKSTKAGETSNKSDEKSAKDGPSPTAGREADAGSGDGATSASQGEAAREPKRAHAADADRVAQLAMFFTALREAGAVFGRPVTIGNIFFGSTTVHSAVGGDVRGEYARSRPSSDAPRGPARSVTAEHLERINATFVCPACFPAAEATLRSTSLLLLRAKPGWGRTTIALKLLARHCSGGLHKLDAETSLARPELPEIEKQHGYMIDALDLRHARKLRPAWLEHLSVHLRDVGAMMVVLLDHGVPLHSGDVEDYVVDGGSPAPPRDVIRSHLRWQLRPLLETADDIDRRASELLDDERVATMVAELSSSSARDLVAFATDLARAHDSTETVADIIDRHSQTVAARFGEWFDGKQDSEQRALAIALAAFHAMPLHIVGRTAGMLADRIRTAENPDPELVRRTLFGTPMRDRLGAANAEVVPGMEATRYGQVAVQLVRFRNGALPQLVLEHVWHQHDEAHEVICDWLHELGSDHDPAVRARAGAAVGLLSLVEFDHIQELVVKPWAAHGGLRQRQAAVAAWHVPSLTPAFRELVREMVLDWVKPHQPINWRMTAIAAMGSVSLLTPERTLRELRRAVRDKPELIEPAAETLTQLFVSAEARGPMLAALLRWSATANPNLRAAAHLAMLWIAMEIVVDVDDAASRWPAVVWLADGTEDHADIVKLFGVLLNAPFTSELTYKLVRGWVRSAGRDPAFLPPLKRFLAAVVAEIKDAASLRWYLAKWRKEKGGPVSVVDELIAGIYEVEVTHGLAT